MKQNAGYPLNVIVLCPNFNKDTLTKEVAQRILLLPVDSVLAAVEFELPAPALCSFAGIRGMILRNHESKSFQGMAVVG